MILLLRFELQIKVAFPWKQSYNQGKFLSDPGIPGVRSMGPSLCNWLSDYTFVQVIQVIQVIASGGQICN